MRLAPVLFMPAAMLAAFPGTALPQAMPSRSAAELVAELTGDSPSEPEERIERENQLTNLAQARRAFQRDAVRTYRYRRCRPNSAIRCPVGHVDAVAVSLASAGLSENGGKCTKQIDYLASDRFIGPRGIALHGFLLETTAEVTGEAGSATRRPSHVQHLTLLIVPPRASPLPGKFCLTQSFTTGKYMIRPFQARVPGMYGLVASEGRGFSLRLNPRKNGSAMPARDSGNLAWNDLVDLVFGRSSNTLFELTVRSKPAGLPIFSGGTLLGRTDHTFYISESILSGLQIRNGNQVRPLRECRGSNASNRIELHCDLQTRSPG